MATAELPRYELYVAGGSFPPANGRFYETVDPYTGEPWAQVPDAGGEDVDRAVGAGCFPRPTGVFWETGAPAAGEPWAQLPDAGGEDVARAGGAARAAFEG